MLVDRKQMDLYEKQTKEKTEGDSRDKSGWRSSKLGAIRHKGQECVGEWGGRLSECLFNSLN